MQAAEYILDDQTLNSEQVSDSFVVFTNCCNFKKGAVVSGQHYFSYCTLSDTHAGV